MDVASLVIDFAMIAALLAQLIYGVGPSAARPSSGRPAPSGRPAGRVGQAVPDPMGWRRRWYGCPPVQRHRACREVSARRDWMDRTASAALGVTYPPESL